MPKPSKVPQNGAPPGRSNERPEKPRRRTFTAAQKLAIVQAADACTERGEVEALLRKHGIYSSHLAAWRHALRLYGEKGLADRRPGRPKRLDPRDTRIADLERMNARLDAELQRARALLAIQKKLSELLGTELPKVAAS